MAFEFISKDGDSTSSAGNLCQCSVYTTEFGNTMKKCLIEEDLNLLCFSLCPDLSSTCVFLQLSIRQGMKAQMMTKHLALNTVLTQNKRRNNNVAADLAVFCSCPCMCTSKFKPDTGLHSLFLVTVNSSSTFEVG